LNKKWLEIKLESKASGIQQNIDIEILPHPGEFLFARFTF